MTAPVGPLRRRLRAPLANDQEEQAANVFATC